MNKFASIFLCLIAVHKHQEMSSMIYSYILNIGYARRNKKADTGYRIQDTGEADDKVEKFCPSLAAIADKLTYKCRKKWQKAMDFPLFVFFLGIFRYDLQRRLSKLLISVDWNLRFFNAIKYE